MKKVFVFLLVLAGFWMFAFSSASAANLDLSMVQPGDILLGYNSSSLRVRSGCVYYTHAALVVSKNMTIETLGESYPNDTVQGYSITNWAGWFKKGLFTRVAVLRVNTSDANRKKALLKAYGEYYKSYMWSTRKSDSMLYHSCSSLVWYAYKYGANIDLDYNGGGYVLPDDIAFDNDIKYISVQGQ